MRVYSKGALARASTVVGESLIVYLEQIRLTVGEGSVVNSIEVVCELWFVVVSVDDVNNIEYFFGECVAEKRTKLLAFWTKTMYCQ